MKNVLIILVVVIMPFGLYSQSFNNNMQIQNQQRMIQQNQQMLMQQQQIRIQQDQLRLLIELTHITQKSV